MNWWCNLGKGEAIRNDIMKVESVGLRLTSYLLTVHNTVFHHNSSK